jgi:hypothetical protein
MQLALVVDLTYRQGLPLALETLVVYFRLAQAVVVQLTLRQLVVPVVALVSMAVAAVLVQLLRLLVLVACLQFLAAQPATRALVLVTPMVATCCCKVERRPTAGVMAGSSLAAFLGKQMVLTPFNQLLIKHRETKKQQLIDQLRGAEADGDDALAESLRRDINALIKEKM